MRIAAELGLPLLTVIDTAGAALSKEAEEGGLAAEIARSLADLVTLPAPTLCLILGQGAGGGALALLPADRVLAARHAWLSPLPPRAPRSSCTAPPTARPNSPNARGSAHPRSSLRASPTRWCPSTRTPPTTRRPS